MLATTSNASDAGVRPLVRVREFLTSILRLLQLQRWLSLLLAVIVWELVALQIADPLLLPTPDQTALHLWSDIQAGTIYDSAVLTFQRGVVGLLIAVAVGVPTGLAIARVRMLRAAIEPVLATLYPTPRLALYPLLVIMLGLGARSEITLVAIECALPLLFATLGAARLIDRDLIWTARNAGAGRLRIGSVVLWGSLPGISAGMRIAVPSMLITAVVVEMIAGYDGLGQQILEYGVRFQIADMLGVVVMLGLLGYILDRGMVIISQRFMFWERGVEL